MTKTSRVPFLDQALKNQRALNDMKASFRDQASFERYYTERCTHYLSNADKMTHVFHGRPNLESVNTALALETYMIFDFLIRENDYHAGLSAYYDTCDFNLSEIKIERFSSTAYEALNTCSDLSEGQEQKIAAVKNMRARTALLPAV